MTQEELQEGIQTASILIGTTSTITSIEEKLERSHEELVVNVPALITTLGDKGSIIETRKESIHIKPVRNIAVIDPTGAGYAYKSGFVCGYLHKYPLDVCGQIGSVAASFAVESHGTQTHTFTKHEFTKRYAEQYHARVKI
ncbi:MAG: PfkB family carbohydrate kinase [Patescibacteria group bacterium]|nr:PfkB family carbohydrate kinase [Patescibacteria group bacterium]